MKVIGRWRHRLSTLGVVLCLVALSIASGVRADACDEPNDTPDKACPIAFNTSVTGTIGSATDVDAYKFDVAQPDTTVIVELTDLPQDYDLYLANARGGIVGQSVREGTGPERIQLTLVPGTYYIYVQVDPSRYVETTAPYTMRLSLNAPSPPTTAPKPAAAGAAPPTAGRLLYERPLNKPPFRTVYTCPSGLGSTDATPDGYMLTLRGKCTPNASPNGVTMACLTVRDSNISIETRIVKGIERTRLILWFRNGATGEDGYFALLEFGAGRAELWSYIRGEFKTLAGSGSLASSWRNTDWNMIELRLDGPAMSLVVNGVELLSAMEGTIPLGGFSFSIGRSGNVNDTDEIAAIFRNVRVTALSTAPEDDARVGAFPDVSPERGYPDCPPEFRSF